MFMGFSHHRNLPNYALQLFLLILSCFFIISAAIDTIRANESLRDSEALISNGNIFKLSFFSPPNSSLRYVGIMYNLPVMTVVWVANRNKPLNDSTGSFQMPSEGNLVILDGRKEIVWSTNRPTSVVNSSAVLLDTGNLVLQDNSNNAYVWESFSHASDSWLAKMQILTDLNRNERNILTSWKSPDDPAAGSFTLTIETLDIPQLFIRKINGDPYWRSGPWDGRMFAGIPYFRSDYSYGTFIFPNTSDFNYYFLNSSGTMTQRVWSGQQWEVVWSSARVECQMYGKCGPFGNCSGEDGPICTCFRGFVPKSKDEWEAGNWTSGCTRETLLQCEQNSSTGKQDRFLKIATSILPDHFVLFPFVSDCRSECLRNCSCIAYANPSGIGCLLWTRGLIDALEIPNGGDDLYIGLAYSELADKKKPDRRAIIVTTVVLGVLIVVVCAFILLKLLLKYRARKHKSRFIFSKTNGSDTGYSEESALKHDNHGVKLEELPVFSFKMLSDATEKFDRANKLGQGGFGLVYKGNLPNGVEIAVKRLARTSNQGVEEFMNEVVVISRLQHRNLVKLIGCCVESEEKMLVYEYMSNGSLDAYLFNSHKRQFVDWKTCKIIIEGICRGLLYLHRDSRLKIIHRDLKASNILLDEELNPKISDFGMARIFCGKDHQANTERVVGTYGYMSPEYALHGIFSEKSDVYSFGVLLLEIVSGKKNSSFYDEHQQLFLIACAWNMWNEGKIVNLIDPSLYDSGMGDDIVRYANVGLLCVQEIAADRPTISTVLSMLSCEIVELPQPKQPAFLAMQMTQGAQSSAKSSSKSSVNDATVSIVEGR